MVLNAEIVFMSRKFIGGIMSNIFCIQNKLYLTEILQLTLSAAAYPKLDAK